MSYELERMDGMSVGERHCRSKEETGRRGGEYVETTNQFSLSFSLRFKQHLCVEISLLVEVISTISCVSCP